MSLQTIPRTLIIKIEKQKLSPNDLGLGACTGTIVVVLFLSYVQQDLISARHKFGFKHLAKVGPACPGF